MIMIRRSITCFILGVSLFHCQSCKKHTEEVQSPEPAPAATPVSLSGSTDSFDASKSRHPSQILFNGDSLPLGMDWSNASLSLDPQRHIWSNHSLRWDWKAPSSVTFHRPIPWMDPRAARRKFKFSQPTQNCFVVWIYNQTAKPDASLRFSFGTGSKELCHFPFALNFTGWRTAWVSYDRDMQGAPKSAMDYVKIESPKNLDEGTLWIGDMLAHHFIDHRHQHGDYQVPFVHGADKLTTGHWDPIMYWYDFGKKKAPVVQPTDAHMAAFVRFRRLSRGVTQRPLKPGTVQSIEKQFAKYHIRKDADGIYGDHVYMHAQLAGAPDSSVRRKGHLLKDYTGFMLRLGKVYSHLPPSDRESKDGKRIAEIFCLLTEHLLDQGFAAGSSLGTMHHFGYNARSWVPAIEAMQEPLQKAGLLKPARETLEWFYNTRQIYAPAEDWANMDYLNTLSKSDFVIQCLGKDGPVKVARLQQYSKWMSDMLSSPSPGNKGGFKPDGSLYHHKMHYHGYGVPAIKVVAQSVVAPLDGTPFEITDSAYEQLKTAYMAARFWGYPYSGFNACGRHPITGSGNQLRGGMLQLAKSKPGTDEVDVELASAYLRMFGGKSKELFGQEIQPEKLHGFYAMNYNAGGSYAYENSTVHLKGYGDGVRSHETYKNANRYGRYLSFGTMQVFKNTFHHVSGHEINGWDWCRLPGATTLRVPLDVLEGSTGFYGSVPKQKTFPSGAGSLEGKYGVFLFQLDPTSDPQSIRVRKSVFAIDRTLICLGSGLSNNSQKYPMVTTLFQCAVPKKDDLSAQSAKVSESGGWLIDPYGAGYFIPDGQPVKHQVGLQESRHSHSKKKTSGTFSTAWIDHGVAPKDAGYYYQVILDASPDEMKAWKKSQKATPFVKILQKDDRAHVITCPSKQIEATAAFSRYESESDTMLRSIDRTSIVMIRKPSSNKIHLSVTDLNLPDLGTKPRDPVTKMVLKGKWSVAGKTDIRITHQDGLTTLVVPTHRGLSRELILALK